MISEIILSTTIVLVGPLSGPAPASESLVEFAPAAATTAHVPAGIGLPDCAFGKRKNGGCKGGNKFVKDNKECAASVAGSASGVKDVWDGVQELRGKGGDNDDDDNDRKKSKWSKMKSGGAKLGKALGKRAPGVSVVSGVAGAYGTAKSCW